MEHINGMKKKQKCQFNPVRGCKAKESERKHAEAVVLVGRGKSAILLCAECAASPRFAHLKTRRPLGPRVCKKCGKNETEVLFAQHGYMCNKCAYRRQLGNMDRARLCRCGCGQTFESYPGDRGFIAGHKPKEQQERRQTTFTGRRVPWVQSLCFQGDVPCARYHTEDCMGDQSIHAEDGSCRVEPGRAPCLRAIDMTIYR